MIYVLIGLAMGIALNSFVLAPGNIVLAPPTSPAQMKEGDAEPLLAVAPAEPIGNDAASSPAAWPTTSSTSILCQRKLAPMLTEAANATSGEMWAKGHEADKALDGNPDTFTESREPGNTHAIVLDLGSFVHTSKIRLLPRSFGPSCCAKQLAQSYLYGATELVNADSWQKLATITNPPAEGLWVEFARDAHVQFVKLLFADERNSGQIAEIEVYANCAGPSAECECTTPGGAQASLSKLIAPSTEAAPDLTPVLAARLSPPSGFEYLGRGECLDKNRRQPLTYTCLHVRDVQTCAKLCTLARCTGFAQEGDGNNPTAPKECHIYLAGMIDEIVPQYILQHGAEVTGSPPVTVSNDTLVASLMKCRRRLSNEVLLMGQQPFGGDVAASSAENMTDREIERFWRPVGTCFKASKPAVRVADVPESWQTNPSAQSDADLDLHVVYVHCGEDFRPFFKALATWGRVSGVDFVCKCGEKKDLRLILKRKGLGCTEAAAQARNFFPNSTVVTKIENFGWECGGYLKYIYSHYDELPPRILFLNGRPECHWPIQDLKKALQCATWSTPFFYLGRNLKKQELFEGYTLPFARWIWEMVTSSESGTMSARLRPRATYRAAIEQQWSKEDRAAETSYLTETRDRARLLVGIAGGQFFVHRERILLHPRAFYKRLLEALTACNSTHGCWSPEVPIEEYTYDIDPATGHGLNSRHRTECLALEQSWHFIFGEKEQQDRALFGFQDTKMLAYDPVRMKRTDDCRQAVQDQYVGTQEQRGKC